MDTLGWGLGHAVPDNATSAWGCRAIVTQGGGFDLVHDRQDWAGSPDVLEALTEEFPLTELVDTVRELLRSYVMSTRRAEPFVLYQGDNLVVVANTNGSAGYCYIAAWLVSG